MSNFTDPLKVGFGRYLSRFYAGLVADTPYLAEFAARGIANSIVWAPGRMVDQVEDMLATWRKNDTSGQAKPTPFLPIMIAAMSSDYTPAPVEYARPMADPEYVMLPADPLERVFKMRVAVADVRVQVAICAPDPSTARSLAMQLDLFCKSQFNRRFYASYPLAGFNEPWPVVLEMPELLAVPNPTEVKNLVILTVDVNMHATVPLLIVASATDPAADTSVGSGTADDPYGYLVVKEAHGFSHGGTMADTMPVTWQVPEP